MIWVGLNIVANSKFDMFDNKELVKMPIAGQLVLGDWKS